MSSNQPPQNPTQTPEEENNIPQDIEPSKERSSTHSQEENNIQEEEEEAPSTPTEIMSPNQEQHQHQLQPTTSESNETTQQTENHRRMSQVTQLIVSMRNDLRDVGLFMKDDSSEEGEGEDSSGVFDDVDESASEAKLNKDGDQEEIAEKSDSEKHSIHSTSPPNSVVAVETPQEGAPTTSNIESSKSDHTSRSQTPNNLSQSSNQPPHNKNSEHEAMTTSTKEPQPQPQPTSKSSSTSNTEFIDGNPRTIPIPRNESEEFVFIEFVEDLSELKKRDPKYKYINVPKEEEEEWEILDIEQIRKETKTPEVVQKGDKDGWVYIRRGEGGDRDCVN